MQCGLIPFSPVTHLCRDSHLGLHNFLHISCHKNIECGLVLVFHCIGRLDDPDFPLYFFKLHLFTSSDDLSKLFFTSYAVALLL